MNEIGSVLTFEQVEYELLENNIVADRKIQKFMIWLNVAAILMFVILTLATFMLGFRAPLEGDFNLFTILIVLLAFLVFIVVHELLHGISFAIFGKVKGKNIKFGIVLKSGLAYCISQVPVKVSASRLSLMMPVYAVCLPMYIYGLVSQNVIIAIVSLLFFTGSIGDLYYMWKLRKTDKNLYMYEMPPSVKGYDIGYLLLKKI